MDASSISLFDWSEEIFKKLQVETLQRRIFETHDEHQDENKSSRSRNSAKNQPVLSENMLKEFISFIDKERQEHEEEDGLNDPKENVVLEITAKSWFI